MPSLPVTIRDPNRKFHPVATQPNYLDGVRLEMPLYEDWGECQLVRCQKIIIINEGKGIGASFCKQIAIFTKNMGSSTCYSLDILIAGQH